MNHSNTGEGSMVQRKQYPPLMKLSSYFKSADLSPDCSVHKPDLCFSPCHHMGDQKGVPGSWYLPGSGLAFMAIWKGN